MRNVSAKPQAKLDEDGFLEDVLFGMSQPLRSIPPKYFYDTRGSLLFDLICTTPEYYPTRTETGILDQFGEQMADAIGRSCTLIELGSGSAAKTPLLLRHLAEDSVYVPIDICEPYLLQSTRRIQAMFPSIRMHPLCADYMQLPDLRLAEYSNQRKVIFFPGSTIGNCTPDEAIQLLRNAAQLVGNDGGLLIGVDCKKSPEVLNAAYNDARGLTAAFNLNLLVRLRRELGAQLDLDGFAHYANYNAAFGRIEMHLISRCKQTIRLDDEIFQFDEGDSIHTENSYKYTAQEFQKLARAAGWHLKFTWCDSDSLFNVHYLNRTAAEPMKLAR